MKPDLLITQIKHADYPVWRMNLARDRHRFNKVIVYFSEHNRFPYFDHFIQSSLSNLDITFLDPVLTDWGTEDWRNKSTNEMLKYSTSDWVCSIEQDWFVKDWNKLLDAMEESMKTSDLIGFLHPAGYIHPAFWYMKREALERTKKDFGAHDGQDHFGWITKDARDLGLTVTSLQDLGFNCEIDVNADCFHLGGVNQNYLEGHRPEYVFHRPDIFYPYNYFCREAQSEQSPLFTELSLKIEERLKSEHPEYQDPKESSWKGFFI